MKERLIGGAVLIAIAVWLVPWVLDGPESTLDTGANSLELPVAEEPVPMRTQTLRLGETTSLETPSSPPSASGATDAAEPAAAGAGAAQAQPEPPAANPVESRTAAAAPPLPAPSAAPVIPPPAAAAAAPPPVAGDWVVQLGSFGEEANARRLVDRAATFGYKATVSSVRGNGRTLYRVRVGPFATRGEADATASALTAHGLVAKAVAAD